MDGAAPGIGAAEAAPLDHAAWSAWEKSGDELAAELRGGAVTDQERELVEYGLWYRDHSGAAWLHVPWPRGHPRDPDPARRLESPTGTH